jgi:dCMP deaminase|tara:strand:+ start:1838 stop:2293 length:456 start_codon:yes stop_codon:yes gene_type:complete
MDSKWDLRFLGLACHIAGWSKDPSTKAGAVVVKERRVLSLGYNGFPMGIDDDPALYEDREAKYIRVVHAEANALLLGGTDLRGATLYTWPFMSCSRCAGLVIQAGIMRHVSLFTEDEEHLDRWGEPPMLTKEMLGDAGVQIKLYPNLEDKL